MLSYAATRWTRVRSVVAKAEHLIDKSNPRFVVTNVDHVDPKAIYERLYCGRGDSENRIKDFKRALSGDRLSDTTYTANAFRLFLHALAYRLLDDLRRLIAVFVPAMARAQFDTVRLRLLKVAAMVDQSVRRIVIRLPSCFGSADLFARIAARIGAVVVAEPSRASLAA